MPDAEISIIRTSLYSNAVSGTGIGLSIAKATVQAHGGKILARQTDDTITFQVIL